MTKRHIVLSLLCAFCGQLLAADEPASVAAERGRIAAERTRIESEYQVQLKACYSKFAVTGCIEDAKAWRRTQLGDLRRVEIGLNDSQRKARAADRIKELERKEAGQARKEPEAAAAAQARRAGREQRAADKAAKAQADAEKAASRSARRAPAAGHAPGDPGPVRSQRTPQQPDVEGNNRRFDDRQKDAQAHKAHVQQRAAEQTKKPADPLPVPP